MPRTYLNALALEGEPKVAGGECARLLQHFIPGIGLTSSWRPGENVVDVLASGRSIPIGTAIATFVNGRYPTHGRRHAALYLGPNMSCKSSPKTGKCSLMSIRMMDQWNADPGSRFQKDKIAARTVRIYGKNSAYPLSDNASMFYIIE